MSLEGYNDFVVLTEVVRKQYVHYLERQLEENVCAWSKKSRNHHKPTAWACIPQSLSTLEEMAVKACMAAQIYQRAMVKMIATIRRNTQECRLANVLFNNMQLMGREEDALPSNSVQCLVDKATQTVCNEPSNENLSPSQSSFHAEDDYGSVELRQKIDLFQARLEKSEADQELPCRRCRQLRRNKRVVLQEQTEPMEDEDAVGKELALIFGEENTDLNEIFGIESTAATDDPQVSDILEELPSVDETEDPPTPLISALEHRETDLRTSRWPCELYAERRRLNSCLIRLLEADWRCEDRLRHKFHILFGEDSDDEFSAQISSPSIDLVDEVLLASCILRIRPWIVRHLMGPLQERLIANRFLFKKLAKMMAYHIVMANPYCSEQQVKQAVEHLFCLLPRGVQSAYDLESLPPVEVERFEV
ncbi:uncharacterized protein LOC117586607 [Drosophila guanche]|uniref:Uncharacterized protein n=1 Tax=Drosophila guanche TaxID=7266 RepID=A0A3B0KG42_DROGU|nr:uncharacterized protein LOC117586607 [Drosophila guanche]SPP84011.1 Hypothetical predicted protein [Drosophila guanche]